MYEYFLQKLKELSLILAMIPLSQTLGIREILRIHSLLHNIKHQSQRATYAHSIQSLTARKLYNMELSPMEGKKLEK